MHLFATSRPASTGRQRWQEDLLYRTTKRWQRQSYSTAVPWSRQPPSSCRVKLLRTVWSRFPSARAARTPVAHGAGGTGTERTVSAKPGQALQETKNARWREARSVRAFKRRAQTNVVVPPPSVLPAQHTRLGVCSLYATMTAYHINTIHRALRHSKRRGSQPW